MTQEEQTDRSDPSALNSRPFLTHILVFVASFLFIWAAILNDEWKDQCLQLLFGQRILRGQVPYRDFFEFVFPASGYAIAAWFKIFGDSMEGVRILNALLGAVTVTLAYEISRLLACGPLLWVGPVGALSAYVVGHQGISHMLFSMPLGLAAMALALRADRSGKTAVWFLAGLLAATAALFTQSFGGWIGIAVLISALTAKSPVRQKLVCGAAIGLSAVVVLAPAALMLVASGAWDRFHYDTLVWPVDRYLPFHGGAAWGGSMPPWGFLGNIPWRWWVVWVPALAVVWSAVWIVPFVPLYSVVHSLRGQDTIAGRRVMLLSCLAVCASIYPNGIAMRMVRLSIPFWPLIALELHRLVNSSPESVARARGVSGAVCACLLFAAGFQWSDNLIQLDTPRGRVRIHAVMAEELAMLSRHCQPGARVLTLPDVSPADYFFKLDRLLSNDHELIPILLTTEQLKQAASELEQSGFPPIIVMQQHYEDMMNEFKPSAHLDELYVNPLLDIIQKNYGPAFEEPFKYQKGSSMVGLVRKTAK